MTISCSRYLYQNSLAASNRWPVRLHALLIWSLLLVSLPGGVGSSVGLGKPHHQEDHHSNIDVLLEASEWLSSRGIRGLCHPSSDEFAPVFPRCPYSNASPSAADHHDYKGGRRQLEEDSYYSYYRYEDDAPQEDNENIVYADPPRTKWYYIFNGSMALACVIGGALASGLTVGLLSLDPLLLVIKMRAGETEKEKLQAEKLLPLVKQHHRLLVTLLLLNTIAGEALPVFLQGMVPDAVAILISVILVLVFGEILPTALFTGPNQIQIASHWAPLVKALMFALFPITYPMARVLDKIMVDDEYDGEEEHAPTGNLYNRGELAALIRVQYEERLVAKQRRKRNRKSSVSSIPDLDGSEIMANIPPDFRQLKASLLQPSPSIDGDEVMFVEGALQMKTKTAMDIYLSFHKVFCVPYDMVLDEANIFSVYASGYSRVPVYVQGDRRQVKGILMTRQLMVVPKDKSPSPCVSDMNLYVPHCVAPETNLVQLVNMFQTGGCAVRSGHMALVCARPDVAHEALERDEAVPEEAGLMGIITLEDVLEALIQEEIFDEMDAAGRKSHTGDSSSRDQEEQQEQGIEPLELDATTSYRQLV